MKIEIFDLKKSFGERLLLNLNRHVFEPGVFHGIVGANGCGKTTLLRILGQLEPSYSGTLIYNGLEAKAYQGLFKQITYLGQNPYLLDRTCFENIAYPLKLRGYGHGEVKAKVAAIMEVIGITHLSHKSAVKLSAGEGQKVALARALVFEPTLLLLDEVTANMDPESAIVIENTLIKDQQNRKSTVISVTHNRVQAFRLCENLMCLEDGHLRVVDRNANDLAGWKGCAHGNEEGGKFGGSTPALEVCISG